MRNVYRASISTLRSLFCCNDDKYHHVKVTL
jgi:hypothetical protein